MAKKTRIDRDRPLFGLALAAATATGSGNLGPDEVPYNDENN